MKKLYAPVLLIAILMAALYYIIYNNLFNIRTKPPLEKVEDKEDNYGEELIKSFDSYIINSSKPSGEIYPEISRTDRFYSVDKLLNNLENHLENILKRRDDSTPNKKSELYAAISMADKINGRKMTESLLYCVHLPDISGRGSGPMRDYNFTQNVDLICFPAAHALTKRYEPELRQAIFDFAWDNKINILPDEGKMNLLHLWRRTFIGKDSAIKYLKSQIEGYKSQGLKPSGAVNEFLKRITDEPFVKEDVGDLAKMPEFMIELDK